MLPPAQTTDYKTFNVILGDSVHSGDAIGSFVSLIFLVYGWFVLSGALFRGIRCLGTVVYMFLVLYRPF